MGIGCGPKPKILPQNRTPENVLRCTLDHKIEFETLACLLDLKLKGKEAKFSGTVEFFYKAQGSFAFYPRSFFGMEVFKATGKNDSLTIYFSKENQFYSGSFSDLEKTKLWSWKIPLKMLLDMILGRDSLTEQNVRYSSSTENLYLYKSEDESWIKEYWIDALRCRLMKSQFMQKSGGEAYQIEYGNYTRHGQMETPKVIKIKSQTQESAQIRFQERRLNLPIPEKKFKLQIPPDAKRVDFETKEK